MKLAPSLEMLFLSSFGPSGETPQNESRFFIAKKTVSKNLNISQILLGEYCPKVLILVPLLILQYLLLWLSQAHRLPLLA